MHTEFDDTVKQIQLFHRNDVYPYQIMLLGFSPNLRHFLHRQGVYHASYWSCFDAIQAIGRKKARVLSFHDLKWPPNVEFIYNMFVVIAFLNGEKYAQINFGEDGNPIQIDLYENGKICRRNIYDDRGFVSSTVVYKDEEPLYQDYLMENGIWKLRRFYNDEHIEINPKCSEYSLQYRGKEYVKAFFRLSYENMEQVIYEVLTAYLTLTDEQDVFCVAMHERHADLLQEALKDRKVILSFFDDRYQAAAQKENISLIRNANYIIADSEVNKKKIQKEFGISAQNIIAVTPYDSREDLGISQQYDVHKILVPIDDIEDRGFEVLIHILGKYLLTNENARIHLFTRKAEYNRPQQLLEWTRRELKKAGLEERWASEEEQDMLADNLEIDEAVPVKFFVEQCVDELTVSQCMRKQRVLVDVRVIPELYLQIMAISVGIPQIVRTKTEYVKHGGNGIVLKNVGKLPYALDYYLNGLENWNKAMVCAYEMSKEYTADKLIDIWRGVIESIE